MLNAKLLVDKACNRISEGLRERAGRAGCLEGEQIDYLYTLEEMLNSMNAAFAKNRARLKQEIILKILKETKIR